MILGCFFFDMKASTYVWFSHGRDGYLVWLSRRVSHNSVLWHTFELDSVEIIAEADGVEIYMNKDADDFEQAENSRIGDDEAWIRPFVSSKTNGIQASPVPETLGVVADCKCSGTKRKREDDSEDDDSAKRPLMKKFCDWALGRKL